MTRDWATQTNTITELFNKYYPFPLWGWCGVGMGVGLVCHVHVAEAWYRRLGSNLTDKLLITFNSKAQEISV